MVEVRHPDAEKLAIWNLIFQFAVMRVLNSKLNGLTVASQLFITSEPIDVVELEKPDAVRLATEADAL